VLESKEKKDNCLYKCDKAHTEYKQSLMWNFFLMFFYEACLEITISIAVGLDYVSQEDDKGGEANIFTRKVHRIMVFGFFAMQIFVYGVICVIMTRKVEIM
jgi:hypothetical protein